LLFVSWLVGWLVGWLLGCLVGWLVGWLVAWLLAWLLGLFMSVGFACFIAFVFVFARSRFDRHRKQKETPQHGLSLLGAVGTFAIRLLSLFNL
jgi:uncharacterized membrane protein YfcA